MKYFQPNEFPDGEFDLLDPRVHEPLDKFRELWGFPVFISPVKGSVARRAGNSKSQHNVTRYGLSRAVDCFPQMMTNHSARETALACAIKAGFTGIGLYPDWRDGRGNHGGIHLDIRHVDRPDLNYRRLALWSGVTTTNGQDFGPIGRVMTHNFTEPDRKVYK